MADESTKQMSKTAQRRLERDGLRAYVLEVCNRCGYRVCTQGHTARVAFGRPRVDANVVEGSKYSSRSYWRKKVSTHVVYIPYTWGKRVKTIGLETLGGLLVLSAEYYAVTRAGSPVMQCRVVRQGLGTAINSVCVLAVLVESGWQEISPAHPDIVHVEAFPAGVDYIRDHGFEAVADSITAAEIGSDQD